jgi:hypothetical protein
MAKRKRKEQEPTEARSDAHEPPTTETAGGGARSPVEQSLAEGQDTAQLNEQPGPPTARKQRPVIGRYFKDRRVELIDDSNVGGLGIKLTYDNPAERPSDEVKQILKEGDGQRPGFTYRGDLKQWRKRIGSDADPRTAVAIRLDAERRVEAIGEQMSHEERLKAERDRSEGPDGKTPS